MKLKICISSLSGTKKGAGLVEFGILVGLISVLSIGAVFTFGGKLRGVFETVNDTLSSQQAFVSAQNTGAVGDGGSNVETGGVTGPFPPNPYPNEIAFEFTGSGSIEYQIAASSISDDMIVDFGDGTPPVTINNTQQYSMYGGNVSHTYSGDGPYVMRISGPVTYMGKSSYGDTNLTKVISLGETLQVTRSLLAQESGVQSVPNLPGSLNNIQRFFESANLTGTVGYANWDISSVRDMNFIFANASSIDSGVAQWDVSNLQIFDAMFQSTTFNEDITGWDTSSATRMSQMFFANTSFMQDITGWNVSGVTYCQRFRYAAPQVPVPSFSSCNPN